MNDDSKAMEAARDAVRTYTYGDMMADAIAQSAVRAYLAQREADGAVMVPTVIPAMLVEVVDDCGWSLSICFGLGDKNRDRMRAYSDALFAACPTP
jgi:hypothetical protein